MKRLAIVFAVALLPLAVFADALPSVPYVQVTGHGRLNAVPDILRVSATVEKTDTDMAVARADVEHRARQVIEAAKKLGVADRDISAPALNIWPEYQWQGNSQIFVGQHVSRRIDITLRDLGRYPNLVSALVKAGVDNTSSANLDRSDMPKLRTQALAKAVEDAHAHAEALAAAAGVALGPVYSISENVSPIGPRPVMMAAAAPRAGGAEYEPGTIQVTADVNMVYLLKAGH